LSSPLPSPAPLPAATTKRTPEAARIASYSAWLGWAPPSERLTIFAPSAAATA
jgi:hypothetical protein